jgi:hypothetical protein
MISVSSDGAAASTRDDPHLQDHTTEARLLLRRAAPALPQSRLSFVSGRPLLLHAENEPPNEPYRKAEVGRATVDPKAREGGRRDLTQPYTPIRYLRA